MLVGRYRHHRVFREKVREGFVDADGRTGNRIVILKSHCGSVTDTREGRVTYYNCDSPERKICLYRLNSSKQVCLR